MGKTLYDGVQELFARYGYYREKTISKVYAGINGPTKIKEIISKFKDSAPSEFANYAVRTVEDFNSQTSTTDGQTTHMDLPSANVLKYILDDETWIAVRPSGTEPKLKLYIGTNGKTLEQANFKLNAFEQSLEQFIAE